MASLHPQLAESPSVAVKALGESKFDLIFLDIGLPETSGFDVCTKIRSTPGHDAVPIVFLTGMSTLQNKAQSKLLGGNDFIGKPFHVLELGIKALLWVSKGRLAEAA
jgi:DNA-binding response OmpR family regulator